MYKRQAQCHISCHTLRIRHQDSYQIRTEICYLRLHSLAVAQGIQRYLSSCLLYTSKIKEYTNESEFIAYYYSSDLALHGGGRL